MVVHLLLPLVWGYWTKGCSRMLLQSKWSNCRGGISRRNYIIIIWFTEHWVSLFLILGGRGNSLKRQGVIAMRSLEIRDISHEPTGDHKVSPVLRSAPGVRCHVLVTIESYSALLPDQNNVCGKNSFQWRSDVCFLLGQSSDPWFWEQSRLGRWADFRAVVGLMLI